MGTDAIVYENEIYFFPLLTYRIEFYQQENNIIINAVPSMVTSYMGNLIEMQKQVRFSIAQILCSYLQKKVEITVDDEIKVYTPDKRFQWIDKKTLLFDDKNCNMIEEYNKNFDYSSLPEKQACKKIFSFVVNDKDKVVFTDLDRIIKN